MTTSVKVAVRVRPFSPKEVTDRTNKIIEMDGPSTIITDPAWFERKETLDELTAEDTEYLYKRYLPSTILSGVSAAKTNTFHPKRTFSTVLARSC